MVRNLHASRLVALLLPLALMFCTAPAAANSGVSVSTSVWVEGELQPGNTVTIWHYLANTTESPIGLMAPTPCDPGIAAGVEFPAGTTEQVAGRGGRPLGSCELQVVKHRVLQPGEELLASFRWTVGSLPGLYRIRFVTHHDGTGLYQNVPIPLLGSPLTFRVGALTDTESHWAAPLIGQGMASGLVTGYPDGTFRPELPITRGEFVRWLVVGRGLQPRQVTSEHWAAPTMAAAEWAEWTNRRGLAPDEAIPRLEIVQMMIRSMGLVMAETTDEAFPDVPEEGRQAVALAKRIGLIAGYPDGTFGPERHATRAEALSILMRLRTYMAPSLSAGATVRVAGQPVASRVLAGRDPLLPELVELGPIAKQAGIGITPGPDGSQHLQLGAWRVTIQPGLPFAGQTRPVERLDGGLFIPVKVLEDLGLTVAIEH